MGKRIVDLRRSYRRWAWKRLSLLLPSLGAALGVDLWLALEGSCSRSIRIPCLSLAVLLSFLIGYWSLGTLACSRCHPRTPLQQARALRRNLSSWGPLCVTTLFLLAVLSLVPMLFTSSDPLLSSASVALQQRSRRVPDPPSIPTAAPVASTEIEPEPLERNESPVPAPPPVQAEAPAPLPPVTALSKPELRPELAREPSPLSLDEKEPLRSDFIDVPYVPVRSSVVAQPAPFEESLSPFRTDPELFGRWPDATGFWVGLKFRPLPDENDLESGLSLEGRVDGFLLLGSGGERVPGLTLMLDFPIGRKDSVLVSWMGVRLPEPDGVEGSDRPNWNHVTLAYSRRLAGYTRHATFDLAVSIGSSADFFRRAAGIPDPGPTPKLTPYAGIDLSFWQNEPIGILLHLGEAFPVTALA